MSDMQEEIEASIRATLSRYPRPRVSPNALDAIVALSVRSNGDRRDLPVWAKRLVLSCYWLCAVAATIAILSSLPLPEWRPSGLTTLAAWAFPVCGVLALCWDPIIAALVEWHERYLQSRAT
jgi:hypothetical protein